MFYLTLLCFFVCLFDLFFFFILRFYEEKATVSLTQNVYVYFRLLVLSKDIEDVMEKDNIIDHDVCLSKVIGCYWAGNVNEQFW